MSSDIAIKVENLSKCYQIYEQPRDRLKQFVMARLQRGLGKQTKQYFREFWALKDVSFEVKKGETVGIIGRNGSGKSTLLQMICGTLNPTAGIVTTHGRIAALLELGSGFNPDFTGRENVYMNAAVLGLSTEEIDQRFDAIVDFADIGEFIEQPVKTYSSGMIVRLAFAVAINVEPDILVVDEALAVGDELFQRKCFSRIDAIKQAGSTILFVSHSGPQIIELCDRAVLIDCGEKLIDGVPKVLVRIYNQLTYAHVDKRESIRQRIRDEGFLKEEISNDIVNNLISNDIIDQVAVREEYFDTHFTATSTVKFDAVGADINTIGLTTEDGRQVNALVRGKSYIFSYLVKFDQPAKHVKFGMAIRTTTGLLLGGGVSSVTQVNSIEFVDKGKIIKVNFSFNCNLNPGAYFLNAGVYSIKNHEEILMCRIVDAFAFRVLAVESNTSNGAIWFAIDSSLSEIECF